ncbi:MAG: class II glutamine amidotransferase [Sulfolobus sp.]
MCRMLAYHGNNKAELERLVGCLIRAANKDPLRNGVKHGDGWGIVAIDSEGIIYYRSKNPIYTEANLLTSLIGKLKGEFKVIIHARQASDKSLVSSYYSHPYMDYNDKFIIYLAHNGSIDKDKLSSSLGIDASKMVDSELALKYILLKGLDSVKELESYTQTALNLFLLVIRRGKDPISAKLYYYNYYKKLGDEYYKLYVNGNAVYSSSLAYTGCERGNEAKLSILSEI